MKTLSLLSVVLLGLVAGCSTNGADTANAVSRTEVVFDHPENFSDVKDGAFATDKGRDFILSEIRDFLVKRTSPLLPDGYRMRVVFTDIDLAGDFEPWRGPQWSDVRIVKSIYPPSFKFTYAITDPTGKMAKEGTESIRDMSFETRILIPASDPLRYEKDILGDWARKTLRDLKKA